MLNFRNTNIFFGLLIIVLILPDVKAGNSVQIGWYIYLLVFIAYTLMLFYGSANVRSDFYMKVLSDESDAFSNNDPVDKKAKDPENAVKKIAISFDDGPAENYTPRILEVLRIHQVPAAFFCIGKNIPGNESLLQQIVDEKHIVGNHSYSHHFWFDMYGAKKMSSDLAGMNAEVLRVTGLKPNLFRPPYGVTNPNLARAVKQQQLVAVGWNIRSMDTVVKDDKKLLAKVLGAVKPGAIVLFHDTCEATFLMLPAFIESVKKQGYEFVRLDKMLNVAPYA